MKRREKEVIKVLLLGQAESGKSTTLKNFRMKYAKEAWRAERASWRAAILLNVVKAVLNILHALSLRPSMSSALDSPTGELSPTAEQPTNSALPTPTSTSPTTESSSSNGGTTSTLQHPPSLASLHLSQPHLGPLQLPPEHAHFIERLLEPLASVERELKIYLGPASEEVGEFPSPAQRGSGHAEASTVDAGLEDINMQSPTPFDPPSPPVPASEHAAVLKLDTTHLPERGSASSDSTGASDSGAALNTAARELVEKRRFANGFLVRCLPSSTGSASGSSLQSPTTPSTIDLDRISSVLVPLVPDMNALWADAGVKELVRKRRVRVEDGVEVLLTDLPRVTAASYVPSDDDIICCRLRTTGVTEYVLRFPTGEEGEGGEGTIRSKLPRISFGKEWIMYDVGGARTNRYAWQSYFENVNAIIFLAPISCFDERLLEDTRINRLEDSFLLWKSIVSSSFFVKTTMVVFLNKVDILRRKLEEGRMVSRFLPSYGTRENEWKVVVKYLRDKFKEMSKQFSPQPRVVYLYYTTVIDTKATSQTLKSVRDGILREHLVSAELA